MAKFGPNNKYKGFSLGQSNVAIINMPNGVQQVVDKEKYQAGLFNENYNGLANKRDAAFVKMKPTKAKSPNM